MNIITPRNRNKHVLWKYIAQTEGITGHRLPRRAVLNTLARWLFLLGIVGLTALCWMALTSSVAAKTRQIERSPILTTVAVPDPCGLDVVVCPEERTAAPNLANSAPSKTDSGSVEAQIRAIADEMGWKDKDWLVALARCESGLRPTAQGDGHYRSRGLFQISAYHHPDISDDQAYSIDWSTRWTITQLQAGRQSLWTCSRLIS
jgi:hypothetical protein